MSAASGILPADVWRGRDAVRAGRRQSLQEGRHVHTTLQEIRSDGDRALVLGIVTSEDDRHRRAVTLPMSWIVRVRGERIAAIRSYTGRAEALARWDAG